MQLQRWHKIALAAFLLSCVLLATFTRPAPLSETQLHEKGLWKSPKLAVDAFIVQHTPATQQWDILLIQRTREPYKDHWALPGGFVGWMEDPVDAVEREVAEETHLQSDPHAPPVFVLFRGSPTRDPRTHTVSAAYAVKVTPASLPLLQRDDDAGDVRWWSFQDVVNSVPIAFDHHGMVMEFLQWFEKEGKPKGLYVERG